MKRQLALFLFFFSTVVFTVGVNAVQTPLPGAPEAPPTAHLESAPAPEAHSDAFNFAETIAHHLSDAPLWQLSLAGYDISITKRVMMLFIVSGLLLLVLIPAARRIAKNPYKKPSRFQGMVESLVNFVRHDVGHASMGHHGKSYEPFLLTLFFFILLCNLLGLIPSFGDIYVFIGQAVGFIAPSTGHVDSLHLSMPEKLWPGLTATGDIGVTAALAGIAFIAIILSGFAYQGPYFIRNIVPKGIPLILWPIMWPIELLGLFTKPFALAIRLLANMTAGHMIILVLLGFIFQFQSYAVAPVSVAGAIVIYLLEIFIAFLQAYIFVFLTALFISQVQHRH